jgi:hypothetical protein
MFPPETWHRGNKWPPENTEPPGAAIPAAWAPTINRYFTPQTGPGSPTTPGITVHPPRAWDSYHFSIVLLYEFAQAWKASTPMTNALAAILANGIANAAAEKADLTEMIEFRPGVMAEALAQKDDITTHFRGALSFNKATHPCTVYLIQGALRAAQYAVMRYKHHFNRRRPSQLWPELMPPIAVPGHASFPSGHATEAYVVARCLQEIVGPAGSGVIPALADAREITQRLAQRIARNREVLGVHYPSDSEGGAMLATGVSTPTVNNSVYTKYMSCPTVGELRARAIVEWQEFT